MSLQSLLLLHLLLLLLSVLVPTKMAAVDCPDRCGDVDIPFPFGARDCAYQSLFTVTCNTSTSPPKAYLWGSPIEVTSITLDGKLSVMQEIAYACYDPRSSKLTRSGNSYQDLSGFALSGTDNKLVGIGCATMAMNEVVQNGQFYSPGCISDCFSETDITNGTCSGIGCCQSPVPKGVLAFNVTVSRFKNGAVASSFNPCSFAFIVEESKFNFSLALFRDLQSLPRFPIVLEWSVGGLTCQEQLKMNKTLYACKGNTTCHNVQDDTGYRCKCLAGYQGNPYLQDGCQDIDECASPKLNDCERICINSPGSYRCRCPKGYNGDDKRNGSGCIRRLSLGIAIAAGSCAALGLLFLVLGTWWFARAVRRRRDEKQRQEFFKRNGGLLLEQKLLSKEGSFEKTKVFAVAELEAATDKFNENRIVGRGGQGTVYKGMLADGRIVAVKKSKVVNTEQLEQFINEFVILSQIDHRNVVKLLGCCLETEIPLLVYEFAPNGTLFHLIHGKTEEPPPSWEMRLRMAAEVANAIAYLHAYASAPVFHRDIKSSNILLDEKMRAKLADFGISKSIEIDQTHFTTQVRGTFGYCDPEYFRSSQFTEKSDVYSFGVVLAELLTGEKPISTFGESEEQKGLVGHFIWAMEEDRLVEILDERVTVEASGCQVVAVAELVKRCLELDGKMRPSMKEIARELEGIRSETKKHEEEEGKGLQGRVSLELGLGPSPSPSPTMSSYDTTASSMETKPLMFHTS